MSTRLVFAFSLASASCLIHIDDVASDSETRPPPGCGFAQPAFCETFAAAASPPGGHGGDSDERRWASARRQRGPGNPPGEVDWWIAPRVKPCGQAVPVDAPEKAIAICNGRLEEGVSIDAEHMLSLRPRQPFDFAGRTGTLAFDVNATFGVLDWLEIWITDLPIPAEDDPITGFDNMMMPKNALGFQIEGCIGSPGSSFTKVWVVKDFAPTEVPFLDFTCFAAKDTMINHIELRLSPSKIEAWAWDAGHPEPSQPVGSVLVDALPLSRGYVQLNHTSWYNAPGDPVLRRWDNIGFDGPFLPPPRGYDFPDALDPVDANTIELGYAVTKTGTRLRPATGVTLENAKSAHLDFNVWNYVAGKNLSYRFNYDNDMSHTWTPVTAPLAARGVAGNDASSLSVPVDLSLLRMGDNTLDFSAPDGDPSVAVANVTLTIETY